MRSEVAGEVCRSWESLATVLTAVPLLVGFPNSSSPGARRPQHRLQCFLYRGARRGAAGQLATTRVELGGGEGGRRGAGRGRGAVEAGRGQPQALLKPLVYGTVVGRQAGGGRVFVWQEGETITDERIIQGEQAGGAGEAGGYRAGHSATGAFLGIPGGLRPGQAGAEGGDDGHQIAILVLHCGGARGGIGLSLVDSEVERLLCLLLLLFHRFGKVVGGLGGLGVWRLSEAGSFTKTEKEAHPGQHGVDGANTGEHWTRLVRSWTRQSGQEN